MSRISYILVIYIAFTFGCRKPYAPKVVAANGNYLVVEGLINTGTDSTFIKLSRTVVLNGKTVINPETKAIVTVENAQGTVYPVPEIVKGTYAAAPLNLDNTKQYRVRIKTSNGKTYVSSLVSPKITPPIDSIGFKLVGNGMQIYVNTHDPNNNTRYYKWNYQETWQFHALYNTQYITNGVTLVLRTGAQQIYSCFGTDASTNTLITTTESLSQDVVYQFPITTIDATSEKVEKKYSILLKQQAITKEAYEFWESLKKNTEDLGSIFDAQPSQLIGNISNIADSTEPVIGYISAGTIQQKRIFISSNQLPITWRPVYPFTCILDSAYFVSPIGGINEVYEQLVPINTSNLAVAQFFSTYMSASASSGPLGYLYSGGACADCTVRGSKTTPSYWK